MILFTTYDLFIMNMMGMGEKHRNIYKSKKQRKNPPFGCPPIPPSIKLVADCFPGRKNLGGMGILIYRGKEKIKDRAWYGSIQTGNLIFIDMNVQDLQ